MREIQTKSHTHEEYPTWRLTQHGNHLRQLELNSDFFLFFEADLEGVHFLSSWCETRPFEFVVEGCLTNSIHQTALLMKTSVLHIQVGIIYHLKYIQV